MDPKALIENFRHIVTQHYIDFNGRTARAPFWHYILVYVVIAVLVAVVQQIIGITFLTGLLALALFLPNLGITVRRLHDTNRSGWWVLIGVVPACLAFLFGIMAMMGGSLAGLVLFATVVPILGLAALALLIYFCAQPGTAGQNQYGADPKAGMK